MTAAIWWIRRDLRLADNQALTTALTQADEIIPVFVFDPSLLNSPYVGDKRLAFLLQGLRQFDDELQARGSRLIIRHGRPADELAKLVAESGTKAIFAEADYSPYARRRDVEVADRLPLSLIDGLTAYPPQAISKANGLPYTVFTPFSRAWKDLPVFAAQDMLPAPRRISTPASLASDSIPAQPRLPDTVPFTPGESEAQRRLAAFVGRMAENTRSTADESAPIFAYAGSRNRMDLEGTSQLSPYLRFGMLSARQAVVAAYEAGERASTSSETKGANTWLTELIWREFYFSILYHFPNVRQRSFNPKYDRIAWLNDDSQYAAWREGRTGYPVVDAAMRQLVQSGWMHNRARMIVGSFLVKDLLVDWRWGERWFMQHLVDGDPAANNGGWQWTAGTGTDAAPYFRVFNPILQGQKFDPNGNYIRRWVPELAEVPIKFIHTPWKMPIEVQSAAACVIGQDYPEPIIDHKWARERTLAAYNEAKSAA
jgi:deoxyribodipyrimidine photo-lyase